MDAIWTIFSYLVAIAFGSVSTWYFSSIEGKYCKELNRHLTTLNGILEDKLSNIKEAKQIYDQLRLLIPPMKKAKPKRKR